MAKHRRAEATPSFGRLCPAMTKNGLFGVSHRLQVLLYILLYFYRLMYTYLAQEGLFV